MGTKTGWILLILILVVASFFRVWRLYEDPSREALTPALPASTPPGLFSDEAMNGNNAHEALKTWRTGGGFKIFYPENNGREGLFINIQALSIAIFGHTSFALRIVSALFGILTVLVICLFAYEYTRQRSVALLAGFMLATSFWHVMFSRIGFRAIMAPFFLTCGMWLLYMLWNRVGQAKHTKLLFLSAVGGFVFGLGFYSYIAYRIAPVLLLPALLLFWREARKNTSRCTLCLPAMYIFFMLLAIVPLALYFGQHPQDFFGRTAQISIFSKQNPLAEFLKNAGLTIQMFYAAGDWNWRHNFAGNPALWWPVALFFTIGIFEGIRKKYALLYMWFFVMLLPVAFSSEGVPHALRAIIMVPPVMIFSAIGFHISVTSAISLFKKAEIKYSEAATIIQRIQKLIYVLAFFILISIGVRTFIDYFLRWDIKPQTKAAFSGDNYAIGRYLNAAPINIPKYVVTSEVDTIDITGRPMELQPIIYATETYKPEPRGAKNIHYITIKEIDSIQCNPDCIVIPIDNLQPTLTEIKKRIPNLELKPEGQLLIARPK